MTSQTNFRAENMETLLSVYAFGLGAVALLGFCAACTVLQYSIEAASKYGFNWLLASIDVALFGISIWCAKLAMKFWEYLTIAKDQNRTHLQVHSAGIECFIGVLYNNNFVQSNRPNHYFGLSWQEVVLIEDFHAKNGRFARLNLKDGKHIDIPLAYFAEQEAVLAALQQVHGEASA